MRHHALVPVLTFALVLGACSQKSETSTSASGAATESVAASQSLTPEQLGELGAQIEKKPDSAKELLQQRGLDEASFEKQIRDVSSDPQASRRYRDAYMKAKA